MPGKAQELAGMYLRRGALASAAIEGNTLNEDQVKEIFDNELSLPESQQYLEQEVRNVWSALREIEIAVAQNSEQNSGIPGHFELSTQWIKSVHSQLLENLDLQDHVLKGEYRTVPIVVGTYKGVPHDEIEFLMEKYCSWINQMRQEAREALENGQSDRAFITYFLAAIYSHLYLAWIHPFGDGNGRTARLIECAIFAHSGLVPWISTNVLSDFYNKTRSRYYSKLETASKNLDVVGFIQYSAQGYRDQLREQVSEVQSFQRKVAWINYVHEQFQSEPASVATRRRRQLILDMPEGVSYSLGDIRYISPRIAEMYAVTSDKLLKRDIGKLVDLELLDKSSGRGNKGKYQVRIWIMDAFRPVPESGLHSPVINS